MRIGIFGGSFDPVHIEHIRVAQAAIQTLGLDKLLIMPVSSAPHKTGRTLAPNAARLEMCRLAFEKIQNAEVSDYEINAGGVSYTYLTCRHFRKQYQAAELFWLVGTDMLRDFPTWKQPQDILENVTLAVCARNEKTGWVEQEQAAFYRRFSKRFVCVGYNGADVSSTMLRVLAGAGESLDEWTDSKVAAYIRENGLYEIPNAKSALALEKPTRKAHTLRVAYLAAKHAKKYAVKEEQAISAALFHDCAKNLPPEHPLLRGFVLPDEWGEVPQAVAHQFSGAYLAENVFGVTDKEVLGAVRYHTSGKPNMSALEKLTFLADMLEEERVYEGVEGLREAFERKSPNAALGRALQETVGFLEKKGVAVYPLTRKALEYYENSEEE
jgi:nicotinate-nucleotide adenylyltransferase